jgi:MFS family permease
LPAVAAGAFLIGIGYGPITPASSHLLARTTQPERMALVFSVKQTGVPLGGMLAGAVVPPLLLGIGWQYSLAVVALACGLCALLSQPLRASLDADRRTHQPMRLSDLTRPIRLVLAHRALATMAACSFVFSIMQMSLSTYLVTFLHDDLSYSLVAAGLALSITQVGGVAGRVAWGYVADRWVDPARMLAILAGAMSLCALLTALLQPHTPAPLVWALLACFGASAIGWNGVYLSEVARQAPPGLASAATGGTLTFTFLGVVLGPPAFGLLSNLMGSFRAGFAALTLISGLACLVLLVWQRKLPNSTH